MIIRTLHLRFFIINISTVKIIISFVLICIALLSYDMIHSNPVDLFLFQYQLISLLGKLRHDLI